MYGDRSESATKKEQWHWTRGFVDWLTNMKTEWSPLSGGFGGPEKGLGLVLSSGLPAGVPCLLLHRKKRAVERELEGEDVAGHGRVAPQLVPSVQPRLLYWVQEEDDGLGGLIQPVVDPPLGRLPGERWAEMAAVVDRLLRLDKVLRLPVHNEVVPQPVRLPLLGQPHVPSSRRLPASGSRAGEGSLDWPSGRLLPMEVGPKLIEVVFVGVDLSSFRHLETSSGFKDFTAAAPSSRKRGVRMTSRCRHGPFYAPQQHHLDRVPHQWLLTWCTQWTRAGKPCVHTEPRRPTLRQRSRPGAPRCEHLSQAKASLLWQPGPAEACRGTLCKLCRFNPV